MKFRPISDWLLVKCDAFQNKSDVITTIHNNESSIRTGTVLTTGPGRPAEKGLKRQPLGVEKGEKIAFLRWHAEHRPGKAQIAALHDLSEELGADVCLIRQNDILFAYTGELRVDVP